MTNTKPVKFAIYKYFLEKTGEQSIFGDDKSREAREALDSILKQKKLAMVRKKRGDTEHETLPLADCEWHEGVAAIMLQKNRNRKAINDYKEGRIEDHPWCWVVFDNREGIGQLAVQYKSDFGASSDAAVRIVEESFYQLLGTYGLKLTVKAKVQEGKFWDTVERIYSKGDLPSWIKFDFIKPEHAKQLDTSGIPDGFVDFQMRLMEMMEVKEGIKSVFQKKALKGHDLDLHRDKVSDDFAHLITLFCNNGYDLRVKFARFGEYQLGRKMRAWREVPQYVVDNFMDGQTSYNNTTGEPEFELVPWLDEVRDSTRTCDNEDISKLTAKRRHKKAQ